MGAVRGAVRRGLTCPLIAVIMVLQHMIALGVTALDKFNEETQALLTGRRGAETTLEHCPEPQWFQPDEGGHFDKVLKWMAERDPAIAELAFPQVTRNAVCCFCGKESRHVGRAGEARQRDTDGNVFEDIALFAWTDEKCPNCSERVEVDDWTLCPLQPAVRCVVWAEPPGWKPGRSLADARPGYVLAGVVVFGSGHYTYGYKTDIGWVRQNDDHKPQGMEFPGDLADGKEVAAAIFVRLEQNTKEHDAARTPLGGGTRRVNTASSPPVKIAAGNFGTCYNHGKVSILVAARTAGVRLMMMSEWGKPTSKDLQKLTELKWSVVEAVREPRNDQDTAERSERRGGAVILATELARIKKIPFEPMEGAGLQVAVAEVEWTDHKDVPPFAVAAIYTTPGESRDKEPSWTRVMARLRNTVIEHKLELKLLGGDVNALHPSWQAALSELALPDSDVRLYRGGQLAAALDILGLQCRGGANTYPNNGNKQRYSLDIIAAKVPLSGVKRLELKPYSDHDLVVATWQETERMVIPTGKYRRAVWCLNGVDLTDKSTKNKLGNALDSIIGIGGVGTMPTGAREQLLRDALQRALESLGARRRYVLQRTRNDDFEETVRSAIDVKKNGDWAELNRFIRSQGQCPPPTEVWRASDPSTVLSGQEAADAFVQHFAETHAEKPRPTGAAEWPKPVARCRIDPEIVRQALLAQRKSAGADSDGVTPLMLAAAAESNRFLHALTRLCEDVAMTTEAPKHWLDIVVTAIGKKDKTRDVIDTHRAIFTVPFLCRVGETVFEWLDRASIAKVPELLRGEHVAHGLDVGQVGFRKGLGDDIPSLAVLALHQKMEDSKGKFVILQGCIDLTGAYPSLDARDGLQCTANAGATPEGVAFRCAIAKNNRMVLMMNGYRSEAVDGGTGLKAGRKGCPTEWAATSGRWLQRLRDAVTYAKQRATAAMRGIVDESVVAASADDFSLAVLLTVSAVVIMLREIQRAFQELNSGNVSPIEVSVKSAFALFGLQGYTGRDKQDHWSVTDGFKLKSFLIDGQRIRIASRAEDEPIATLGIIYSLGKKLFEHHIKKMVLNAQGNFAKVTMAAENRPLSEARMAYDALVLAPMQHSLPIVIGKLTGTEIHELDAMLAAHLKELAMIPRSARNASVVHELGFLMTEARAMKRVISRREQLVRVTAQARKAKQPITVAEQALRWIETTMAKYGVDAPSRTGAAPVIWDAPPIDPATIKMMRFVRVLADHEHTADERRKMKEDPESAAAAKIKAMANLKRRAQVLHDRQGATHIITDGSIVRGDTGEGKGAAALLYLPGTAQASAGVKKAAPKTACTHTCESIAMDAGLDLPPLALDGQTPLVVESDSLSKIASVDRLPFMAKKFEAAATMQKMAALIAKGTASDITLMHTYSHVDKDPKAEAVDADAKDAARRAAKDATEAKGSLAADDARELFAGLQRRLYNESERQGGEPSKRATHGPGGPTKWSGSRSWGVAEERITAQIRCFSCPQLGGHLHGEEHARTCGLCGAKCGKYDGLEEAVIHLFRCEKLQRLRAKWSLHEPKEMWAAKTTTKRLFEFVKEAALASKNGDKGAPATRLGAEWRV